MIVGVPTEVKDNEFRVALTPAGARELSHAGHEVLLQAGAGTGSSVTDEAYVAAGARIVPGPGDAWAADLVLKVKEPVASEYGYLRANLTLFTYLHLAANRELTDAMLASGVTGIAYETVRDADGRLPLLAPMSEIAGRMAPHVGANLLERERGGRGVLLGGAAGVAPARVLVLGAGMAGASAAWIAAGMEAEVVILDRDVDRLRFVDQIHRGRVQTITSSRLALEDLLPTVDLLVGAVLVPGARAPHIVTREMVATMRPGSVLVDISIDQGGCIETSRMTTHSDPIYVEEGVVHYCVGNMPGAVPNTSTYALTNVTLPYVLAIADHGADAALTRDPVLGPGLNTRGGSLTDESVAAAHGLPVMPRT